VPQRLSALRAAWRRSRRAKRHEPVFIVGDARSGTSLLYRCLLLHPRFAPTRPTGLVESKAIPRLADWDRLPDDERAHLHRFLHDEPAAWRQVAQLQAALAPLRRIGTRLPARVRMSRPVWVLSGQRMVVRTYFSAAAEIREVDRLVEKSPRHAMFVGLLASAYPRSRMIYLHRHPVDTFSSYRRRAETDGEFAGIDAHQFVTGWRRRINHLLEWQRRHPDRVLVLGYEGLVADPEKVLRRILEFLGEEWHPAVLPEERKDRSPHHDRKLFGTITASGSDWADTLSLDEARTIESSAAEEMTTLGYAPQAL
jgi:hypothetical protein